MLTNWIKSWLVGIGKVKPRKSKNVRLSIDVLEERCLLTNYIWSPQNNSTTWALSTNWFNSDTNRQNAATANYPGQNGSTNDTVTFSNRSTANCFLPQSTAITLQQFTVTAGYATTFNPAATTFNPAGTIITAGGISLLSTVTVSAANGANVAMTMDGGTIRGPGGVTVSQGLFNWNGGVFGTVGSFGPLQIGANANLTIGGAITINGSVVTINGDQSSWTGGNITLNSGAIMRVAPASTFTISILGQAAQMTSAIGNNCTFQLQRGGNGVANAQLNVGPPLGFPIAPQVNIGVRFNDFGAVNVTDGTLNVLGNSTAGFNAEPFNNGTFNISPGAVVNFGAGMGITHSFFNGSQITGPGTALFQGTMILSGVVSVANATQSGTVRGAGNLMILGRVESLSCARLLDFAGNCGNSWL